MDHLPLQIKFWGWKKGIPIWEINLSGVEIVVCVNTYILMVVIILVFFSSSFLPLLQSYLDPSAVELDGKIPYHSQNFTLGGCSFRVKRDCRLELLLPSCYQISKPQHRAWGMSSHLVKVFLDAWWMDS